MATDTQMPSPVFAEPAVPIAVPTAVPVTDADKVRSKENIAQWKKYLPEDCAKAMIDMGWDVTT
jgi:hypothetical protein